MDVRAIENAFATHGSLFGQAMVASCASRMGELILGPMRASASRDSDISTLNGLFDRLWENLPDGPGWAFEEASEFIADLPDIDDGADSSTLQRRACARGLMALDAAVEFMDVPTGVEPVVRACWQAWAACVEIGSSLQNGAFVREELAEQQRVSRLFSSSKMPREIVDVHELRERSREIGIRRAKEFRYHWDSQIPAAAIIPFSMPVLSKSDAHNVAISGKLVTEAASADPGNIPEDRVHIFVAGCAERSFSLVQLAPMSLTERTRFIELVRQVVDALWIPSLLPHWVAEAIPELVRLAGLDAEGEFEDFWQEMVGLLIDTLEAAIAAHESRDPGDVQSCADQIYQGLSAIETDSGEVVPLASDEFDLQREVAGYLRTATNVELETVHRRDQAVAERRLVTLQRVSSGTWTPEDEG